MKIVEVVFMIQVGRLCLILLFLNSPKAALHDSKFKIILISY